MRESKELPIARIAGVWGAEQPVEGHLYLKLQTNVEIVEEMRNEGKSERRIEEIGPIFVGAIALVDHTGTKIECGNILTFRKDETLNGMVYCYLNKGIAPQVYLCRNNETNGIFVKE